MDYANEIYNPTSAYVARLLSDGSYGTPVYIAKLEKIGWSFEADTDEIKAYGMITDGLTIPTKATGTIDIAHMNIEALTVMTEHDTYEYDTTPNRRTRTVVFAGGAGLPYFAIIAAFAAQNGANMIGGFAKAMLTTYPAFDIDQNQFRRASTEFNAYAPDVANRRLYAQDNYETAGGIPTTAEGFATFFTEFTS